MHLLNFRAVDHLVHVGLRGHRVVWRHRRRWRALQLGRWWVTVLIRWPFNDSNHLFGDDVLIRILHIQEFIWSLTLNWLLLPMIPLRPLMLPNLITILRFTAQSIFWVFPCILVLIRLVIGLFSEEIGSTDLCLLLMFFLNPMHYVILFATLDLWRIFIFREKRCWTRVLLMLRRAALDLFVVLLVDLAWVSGILCSKVVVWFIHF